MIDEALRAILMAHAGTFALVGARIYPEELPEAPTLPAITYQQVSGASHYHMEGDSGLESPRFQFVCHASTRAGQAALRRQIKRALSGFHGVVGSPPVRIQGVFHAMDGDAFPAELTRAGPGARRKIVDFTVWYEEPV